MIKLKYLKIFQISLFQAITGSIPLLTTDKELITIRLFITVHGITRSAATHLFFYLDSHASIHYIKRSTFIPKYSRKSDFTNFSLALRLCIVGSISTLKSYLDLR